MEKTLRNLAFELDYTMGSIGLKVGTLSDMQTVLGQLRVSMDTALHRGETHGYNHEHHREVRLLSDLMYYVMKELNETYEKAQEINTSIFEAIIKPGNDQLQEAQ